jgi:hypothetical protein
MLQLRNMLIAWIFEALLDNSEAVKIYNTLNYAQKDLQVITINFLLVSV